MEQELAARSSLKVTYFCSKISPSQCPLLIPLKTFGFMFLGESKGKLGRKGLIKIANTVIRHEGRTLHQFSKGKDFQVKEMVQCFSN